jgi:hypothetical protein
MGKSLVEGVSTMDFGSEAGSLRHEHAQINEAINQAQLHARERVPLDVRDEPMVTCAPLEEERMSRGFARVGSGHTHLVGARVAAAQDARDPSIGARAVERRLRG